MRKGDIQIGAPFVNFSGTTTELDALTGVPAGALAWDETLETTVEYDGAAWVAMGGGLTDAPSDGFLYGRRDADWEVVPDTDMAGQIGAASADVVVDTDTIGFLQVFSGLLKKITWANIKATLKTYFDTLYSGVTEPIAAAHIGDTTDAHDASAISIVDSGNYFTGTEVEAALQEVGAAAFSAGAVTSVNSQTGAVVLDSDDISEGSTNKYVSAANLWASLSGLSADTPVDGDYVAWIKTASGVLKKVTFGNLRDTYLRANLDTVYAPIAKGVTNGDTHDHNGGDGAQINHTTLSNIGTNTHAQIDTFIAATSSGRVLLATSSPSGTGTVSFTSIAATYNHLEIEYVARSTKASVEFEAMKLFFNNDTTVGDYRYIRNFVFAAGSFAGDGGDDAIIDDIPAANALANNAARGLVVIPFYKETTFHKNASLRTANRRNAGTVQQLDMCASINWENAAAISRVDFILASGNFVSGSTFNLYGVY